MPAILFRALAPILAAFIAGTAAAFLLALLWGLAGARNWPQTSAGNLQALSFIAAALCAAAVLFVAMGPAPPDLPPARRKWIGPLGAILLAPVGAALSILLTKLSPEARAVGADASLGLLVAAALCGASLTPLAEELFFRQWLWRRFEQARGPAAAAVATGALFLVAHLIEQLLWGRFGAALARGILFLPLAAGLSLVRAMAGTPRASLLAHACYNLAALLAPLAFAR